MTRYCIEVVPRPVADELAEVVADELDKTAQRSDARLSVALAKYREATG